MSIEFLSYKVQTHFEVYWGPKLWFEAFKVPKSQVFQVVKIPRRFDKVSLLGFYSLCFIYYFEKKNILKRSQSRFSVFLKVLLNILVQERGGRPKFETSLKPTLLNE